MVKLSAAAAAATAAGVLAGQLVGPALGALVDPRAQLAAGTLLMIAACVGLARRAVR